MPEKIVNHIQEIIASAAGIPDALERSRKYRNIAGMLSQEAVRSNDGHYIDEALKIAALVTDDPSKAYVEIIRAIARMKRKDKITFDKAIEITKKIDNDLDLSVALYEIIFAFGKSCMDNKDKKDNIIYGDAIDLIEKIPLETYRAKAYRDISTIIADNDPKNSRELLEKSINILNNTKGIKTAYLVSAFCDTGTALARFNDRRSYEFLEKAIALADNVNDDFDRSALFLKILEADIEIGMKFRDKELLNNASMISKNITREYYKTLAAGSLECLTG